MHFVSGHIISVCIVCSVLFSMWQNYVGHDAAGRQAESRHVICSAVYQLLIAGHTNMSSYIRNKMAKLVVCVARQDWPHHYQDFFTNIYIVRERLSPDCVIVTCQRSGAWWEMIPLGHKCANSRLFATIKICRIVQQRVLARTVGHSVTIYFTSVLCDDKLWQLILDCCQALAVTLDVLVCIIASCPHLASAVIIIIIIITQHLTWHVSVKRMNRRHIICLRWSSSLWLLCSYYWCKAL